MSSTLFEPDLLPWTKQELGDLRNKEFGDHCFESIAEVCSFPVSLDMIEPSKRHDFITFSLFPDEDVEKAKQKIFDCFKEEMQAVIVAKQIEDEAFLNPDNNRFKVYDAGSILIYYMDAKLPSGREFRINLSQHVGKFDNKANFEANVFFYGSEDFTTITDKNYLKSLGYLVTSTYRPPCDTSDYFRKGSNED